MNGTVRAHLDRAIEDATGAPGVPAGSISAVALQQTLTALLEIRFAAEGWMLAENTPGSDGCLMRMAMRSQLRRSLEAWHAFARDVLRVEKS